MSKKEGVFHVIGEKLEVGIANVKEGLQVAAGEVKKHALILKEKIKNDERAQAVAKKTKKHALVLKEKIKNGDRAQAIVKKTKKHALVLKEKVASKLTKSPPTDVNEKPEKMNANEKLEEMSDWPEGFKEIQMTVGQSGGILKT